MELLKNFNKKLLCKFLLLFSALFMLIDSVSTLLLIDYFKLQMLLLMPTDSLSQNIIILFIRCIVGVVVSILFIYIFFIMNSNKNKFSERISGKAKNAIFLLIPCIWSTIVAFELCRKHNDYNSSTLVRANLLGIIFLTLFFYEQALILVGLNRKNSKVKILCFGIGFSIITLIYNVCALCTNFLANYSHLFNKMFFVSGIFLSLYVLSFTFLLCSNEFNAKVYDDVNKIPKFVKSSFEWVDDISMSFLIVFFILTYVFQTSQVSGSSMEHTLQDSDRLIISDFMYKPKCGDIVVVNLRGTLNERIIKRVIATGGQTLNIDFDKNQVFVDGELLDEPYTSTKMEPINIVRKNYEDGKTLDKYGDIPEVIPEDCVFVMGDNRANSLDSRYSEVGVINENDIVGKVNFRFLPLNKMKIF